MRLLGRIDECPLLGVKQTWNCLVQCPLVTQSGHLNFEGTVEKLRAIWSSGLRRNRYHRSRLNFIQGVLSAMSAIDRQGDRS
jgi:hypothetical protein